MAELAALPPDQRAALQLLLTQGQSYEQLAKLLNIDAEAVRRRARAGLEALGPEAGRRLTEERRAEVADYLLGQQSASQREATRAHLTESAAARAWARGVANALREVAPDAVPDVPGGDGGVAVEAAPAAEEGPAPALAEQPAAPRARERLPRPRAGIPTPPRPSSRLGGALLLAGAAIVVAVVVVLIVNSGGGGKSSIATKPSTTKTNQATQPIAQINLFAPSGKASVVGLAQVFRMGSRRAIVIAGQGLSPGTYALWLYNSRSDARLLGFVPQKVGSNGRFATQGELPADAERFRRMVVTRETVTTQTKKPPTQPGTIALQGDLKLG